MDPRFEQEMMSYYDERAEEYDDIYTEKAPLSQSPLPTKAMWQKSVR